MKTLKSLLMLCIAAMLCGACAENGGDEGNGALTLSANPSSIMANVETTQLVVKIGNKRLSADEITLYNEKGVVIEVPNLQFSSDTPGTYGFQAGYHHPTNGDMLSNFITVRVTKEVAMPEAPVDAEPSNLDFERKIMYIRFTGTGCGACPILATALRSVLSDDEYKDSFIECAVHQYGSDDPAYLTTPQLEGVMGVATYPTSILDMNKENSKIVGAVSANLIKQNLDKAMKRVDARVGIAANSKLDTEANSISVLAKIKVNTAGEYRIGAWLLEDNIYGKQTNASAEWHNYHNNSVRYVDSKYGSNNYTGYSVGNLSKGEYADWRFIFDIDEMWVPENCHIAIFVSSKEDNGKFYVNNIINVPLNGSVGFNYAK